MVFRAALEGLPDNNCRLAVLSILMRVDILVQESTGNLCMLLPAVTAVIVVLLCPGLSDRIWDLASEGFRNLGIRVYRVQG